MRIRRKLTLTNILAILFVLELLLTYFISATRADPKASPFGLWLTQAGDAKVGVTQCGETICGRVKWLKQPIDSTTGQPQTDDKNPDPLLKERPVIGLQLFAGMRPSASNAWSGRIYNADNGQSYAGTITILDGTRLEVRGCAGALCGTEVWTRTTR